MDKITIDEFCEKFKVRANPIGKPSPFGNRLLDMDEDELDFLEEQDSRNVWTMTDGGEIELRPGLHYKNVLGYFVCGEKWRDKKQTYSI